ncbi:hypothetical protein [Calothrix sp. UHCC 0171]|uniref:hypothetical protein n=1 Tax=Calothrix sp. UHCC 0171 TaxID=3110245 RepID=UPI002B20760F|nr:hypothetical protein [Calothrix sp. UHCC 0171]MEA5572365.1 hypothetical protein [Calothrix sp. UHCC 0171]
MTNPSANNANNDEIRQLIAELARKQIETQEQLDMFLNQSVSLMGRNAILNDVILEVRENTEVLQRNFETHQQNFERLQRNFEQHQQNFHENQRTTNAALNSLEAILLQLTRIIGRE